MNDPSARLRYPDRSSESHASIRIPNHELEATLVVDPRILRNHTPSRIAHIARSVKSPRNVELHPHTTAKINYHDAHGIYKSRNSHREELERIRIEHHNTSLGDKTRSSSNRSARAIDRTEHISPPASDVSRNPLDRAPANREDPVWHPITSREVVVLRAAAKLKAHPTPVIEEAVSSISWIHVVNTRVAARNNLSIDTLAPHTPIDSNDPVRESAIMN